MATFFVFTLILGLNSTYADVVGRLAAVQGDVKIDSKILKQTSAAILGEDVSESDTIVVGSSGKAKILMEDENELNIFSNTQLEIVHYDSSTAHRNSSLNLLSGKIRAIINQKYDGASTKFEIKTPIATTSVKGTDFLVQHDSSTHDSTVVTFKGIVQLGSLDKNGNAKSLLPVETGQTSEVKGNRMASQPVNVDSDELARLDKETKLDAMPPPKDKPPVPQSKPSKKKKRGQIQL